MDNNEKVDVVINVCGKPYQTALTLLSLMRYSGSHIGKIYFIEENVGVNSKKAFNFNKKVVFKKGKKDKKPSEHARLIELLGDRLVHFTPKHWLWIEPADPERAAVDEEYRLSVRYQYGFEKSDKGYIFITHNDCIYFDDIIGALLHNIDNAIATGHVGQCWNCPASWAGKCSPETYENYRPDNDELKKLYETTEVPEGCVKRDVFSYDQPWLGAWPLPECRVNEWCTLINLDKARSITQPLGTATLFGNYFADNRISMDIGVGWFQDVIHLGYRIKHYWIYNHMKHTWGHPSMSNSEIYNDLEKEAEEILKKDYSFVLNNC